MEVRYVDTDHFKGSTDVSRVVLLADKETVYELARLYKNKKEDELNEHPYLANALSQIKYQLESYYMYAKDRSVNTSYLRSLTKTLSTFYRVYSEKEAFVEKNAESVANTEIFKQVQSFCDKKLNPNS